MIWRNILYLFISVNISIISFIAKSEATGNPETEILEESSSKGKQCQHEKTGTSSGNVLHQSQNRRISIIFIQVNTANIFLEKMK